MRYIVLLALIIGVYGCSTKETALRTYTINPQIDIDKQSSTIYSTKSIKIAYPTSIKGIVSRRMTYSYNDLEVGTYNNARWSVSNGKLLMNSYIKALDKSHLFGAVIEYTSLAETNYLLESEVYEFYHKIRGKVSLSIVSVKFNFIAMDTNRLIKSKKFSYQIPTATLNAQGYVEATNIAVKKMTLEMIEWLGRGE